MHLENQRFLQTPNDLGPPSWWHGQGFKVGLQGIDPRVNPDGALLKMGTRVVNFELGSNDFHRGEPEWWLKWFIGHSNGESEGRRTLERDQLAAMFGLIEAPEDPQPPNVLAKYRASCMVQGLFMRRGPYLCVPGPGTGWDGDPNVSIFVTPEIADAVYAMITGRDAGVEALQSVIIGSLARQPCVRLPHSGSLFYKILF